MTLQEKTVGMLLVFFCVLIMSGCAGNNPKDPFETVNRTMYGFNKGLDRVALKPAAKAYDAAVPGVVDARVDSVISNLSDVKNLVNSLLQAKFKFAGISLTRLVINSSMGLGGLFDPASGMGLEQHKEDFGQTLATWGVPSGPYVMLPLLGPSTVRDALSRPIPVDASYVDMIDHVPTRNTLYGLDALNVRQDLFKIDPILADATDEYAYVRDAWLQNRNFNVYDGKPPVTQDDCDPEDEGCE